jgi:hypothetical protein
MTFGWGLRQTKGWNADKHGLNICENPCHQRFPLVIVHALQKKN